MIPVNRAACPLELTDQVRAELTAEFCADGSKSVWNKSYIRDTLLTMSSGKCVYCETFVDEESKYMEVDHFRNKLAFTELVVSWENLLPSCKRCNVNKSSYNVDVDGSIIDPTVDVPKHHLKLGTLYRYQARTEQGARTIEAVYLNESDRLVRVRFDVGERVQETLVKLLDQMTAFEENPSNRRGNSIRRGVALLLKEGLPEREYSATVATVLSICEDYNGLKERMQAAGIWSQEHELLDEGVQRLTLK